MEAKRRVIHLWVETVGSTRGLTAQGCILLRVRPDGRQRPALLPALAGVLHRDQLPVWRVQRHQDACGHYRRVLDADCASRHRRSQAVAGCCTSAGRIAGDDFGKLTSVAAVAAGPVVGSLLAIGVRTAIFMLVPPVIKTGSDPRLSVSLVRERLTAADGCAGVTHAVNKRAICC
jgi:hypothetical protein